MTRLSEMLKLIPKTLAANSPPATLADQRQQRLAELRKDNYCPVCANGKLLAPGQACRKCIRGNDGL